MLVKFFKRLISASIGPRSEVPVTLPPGLSMLLISPAPTGSVAAVKRTGIALPTASTAAFKAVALVVEMPRTMSQELAKVWAIAVLVAPSPLALSLLSVMFLPLTKPASARPLTKPVSALLRASKEPIFKTPTVLLAELHEAKEKHESVKAAKIIRFFFIMFTSYKKKTPGVQHP